MVAAGRRTWPWHAAALAVTSLSAGGMVPPAADPCLTALVTQRSPLTAEDLAKVDRGDVALDVLPALGARQVGIVGMVRIRAPVAVVRDSLATVRPMIGGEYLEGFGLLGENPAAGNLAPYRMPESDIEALWSCVPGDCRVKITLPLLRLLGSLSWRGGTPPPEIHAAIRGWMAGYVEDYSRGGRDALVVFQDKQPPQSLDAGFRELVTASPLLVDDLPELRDYVVFFPKRALPGATDRFTWSLQDFGLRPTTTISHTVVQDRPGSVPRTVVVRKQLYASHYLHAALMVVALVEDTQAVHPATYVVSYDHYLFDDDVGLVRRLLATRRLRRYLDRRLEGLRTVVESGPARVSTGPPDSGETRECPFVTPAGS